MLRHYRKILVKNFWDSNQINYSVNNIGNVYVIRTLFSRIRTPVKNLFGALEEA